MAKVPDPGRPWTAWKSRTPTRSPGASSSRATSEDNFYKEIENVARSKNVFEKKQNSKTLPDGRWVLGFEYLFIIYF